MLAAALVRQLLDHARRESPRECCGLLTLARGGASRASGALPDEGASGAAPLSLRYYPARNVAVPPDRYEIDPNDLLRVLTDAEATGGTLWGLFHSHVRHEAFPSPVDRAHAYYPEAVHLILSLRPEAATGKGFRAFSQAVLRGYRLADGAVKEVPLALAAVGSPADHTPADRPDPAGS